MRFSEFFSVKDIAEEDDWLDIILSLDTKLFIDPFLIYANEFSHFKGSHAEVISFFNGVFESIALSNGNNNSPYWRNAKNILIFPEADEFCLGYTGIGTKGSGSGSGFATAITFAIYEAIKAGLKEITHFEEIGILREGIGADRISDITATILKHRFAVYTKEICARHNILTKPCSYRRGIYNNEYKRWDPIIFNLPINPFNNKPILLAPKAYIRELPSISSNSFWDYCISNENEILRAEFGKDISKNVNKKTIINFATRHPDIRANFIKYSEETDGKPYDFNNDPKGLYLWYQETYNYCLNNSISTNILDIDKFKSAIENFILEFQNFVENNRGWSLLWNDDGKNKSEEATQLLFLGIVKNYCKANNIDISRESNIGRGPVDFKVSQGYKLRALLEVKLAKNSKFWNGLEKQLIKYLESENIDIGYYIVIVYTDSDIKRISKLNERVTILNEKLKCQIKFMIIDARINPLSASKL